MQVLQEFLIVYVIFSYVAGVFVIRKWTRNELVKIPSDMVILLPATVMFVFSPLSVPVLTLYWFWTTENPREDLFGK